MGLVLEFQWTGAKAEIDRTLSRVAGNIDLAPVWHSVTRRFTDLEQREFASGGSFGGDGWAALKPDYARWKAVHYPGKGILVRTGALMGSLTSGPQVKEQDRHSLRLGTAIDYAKYHRKRRPPIAVPEAEKIEWKSLIRRFVVTGES